MDENQVIQALCRYLVRQGYTIRQRRHTTQQGVDIIAEQTSTGRVLYVEAKGGTSSRQTSRLFGNPYTSVQVRHQVAFGVFSALKLLQKYRSRSSQIALAFPDSQRFRSYLDSVSKILHRLGVVVYLVTVDGDVLTLSDRVSSTPR